MSHTNAAWGAVEEHCLGEERPASATKAELIEHSDDHFLAFEAVWIRPDCTAVELRSLIVADLCIDSYLI